MRRRTLLRRGPVLAALGLAGCTGAPTDEATDSPRPDTPSPTPSPMATGTPEPTDTPTSVSTTESPTPAQEVAVGPDASLRFEPASFQIAVGDTVLWTWDAGGHNVKSSSTPDGSDWAGTPGDEFDTFDSGYTYTHTFEVAGTYEYYCAPHQGSGMTGSFTVG